MRNYRLTITASFTAYIVQAIINNFLPLLFLTIRASYDLRLDQIAWLVTFNFLMQLLVDFAAIFFVDRIGYRRALIIAHIFASAGLILLGILPQVMANSFAAFLICVTLYAVGGGLIEVLVSPLVDATPSPHKSSLMSILHSFYCWGHVAVVLLSTLFFWIFGRDSWPLLAMLWALVPLVNTFAYMRAPIPEIPGTHVQGKLGRLFKRPLFWFFVILMIAAGAMEQSVSQWASTYAEAGLGVSKAVGDIAGPLSFAVLMGLSRALYGRFGPKLNLRYVMLGSAVLGVAAFLLISFAPTGVLSFVGIAVAGFAVGIMWPGSFSLAAEGMPLGGTALFAMLALAGDIGCALGPAIVGQVAGDSAASLAQGIFVAGVFPFAIVVLTVIHLLKRPAREVLSSQGS